MARPRLTDPVDGDMRPAEIIPAETEVLSIEQLTPDAVKPSAARAVDPFANYPFKYVPLLDKKGKQVMDENQKPVQVCVSYIVLYNHLVRPVVQDPSNRGRRVNYHSRGLRDYIERVNHDIVFDRPFKTAKGLFYGALVPQHTLRAQLIFNHNTKAKEPRVEIDNRYLLLDMDQVGRLRQVFYQIINPKLLQEKQAQFISGETSQDPGDTPEPSSEE